MRPIVVTATVLLICPVLGHTQNPAESCIRSVDEQARLLCYDNLFRDPSEQPGAIESAAVSAGISPIDLRRAQESVDQQRWFSITSHKPNYLIPASVNPSADFSIYGPFEDQFEDAEVKFQLSLKTRIWPKLWRDSSLWVGYTQQSYWQLYADDDASAPFRETNHEPELMWNVPVSFRVLGWNARQATLAFNHQSNGQVDPLSRSWNRITGQLVFERGRFVASAKTWYRLDESDAEDDNPDIEEFMGRVELGAIYRGDRHSFAIGLKNNLSSENRSGVEFNWTFPLAQHLRGFVQIYSGYGENLLDMENYTNRVGIGIALTDWL